MFTHDLKDWSSIKQKGLHAHEHYVLHGVLDKGQVFKECQTAFGLITLVEDGQISLNSDGDIMGLDEHSYGILSPNKWLKITCHKPAHVIIINFNQNLSTLLGKSCKDDCQVVDDYSLLTYSHKKSDVLSNHLESLVQLRHSCSSFAALKVDMILRAVLDEIIEENLRAISDSSRLKASKDSTRASLHRRLAAAKEWMVDHMDENISLEDLAKVAMLDKFYFLRAFKSMYGETPHQYLTKERIKVATWMLQKTSESVSAICIQVGFQSLQSFSTLFKKYKGASPLHYRKASNSN